MAVSESAVPELFEMFRTGEGHELIRECVRVASSTRSRPRRPPRSAPPETNALTPGGPKTGSNSHALALTATLMQ